ncbi:hypothetical protein NM208_g13323 [Fusarium decemcellulare]|uniref:Uncharacterized protein n=1 Tax=Fusarium decemcellulare TaxID=57161 RepID=A0ACC1RLM3_9HYPO|nr:hypothetical protein NM208_g13323 [Fusarium decemcellulare]
MSSTSVNPPRSPTESKVQSDSVSQLQGQHSTKTGYHAQNASLQISRFLNDPCGPVTARIQDPSFIPGTRPQTDLHRPPHSVSSHGKDLPETRPHHGANLAGIGAQFCGQGSSRPADRAALTAPTDLFLGDETFDDALSTATRHGQGQV